MAFLSRWVYGYVYDAGGVPVLGGQVKAKLDEDLSFTETHVVVQREFHVVTDSTNEANNDPVLAKEPGKFRLRLWCDETALKTINYQLFFPVVDGGSADKELSVELSLAYEDGAPKSVGTALIEGSDPVEIADDISLRSVIDARTANHITFSPQSVANQAARLALTGLRKFHHVRQADNGHVFLLIDELDPSDSASWLNLSQSVNTNTINFAAATQGATISSTNGSPSIANLINGSRVYSSANWNGQDGDIITVSFNQNRLIHRIDLYSVTGDESDRPNEQNPYSILQAEIYAYVGNAWVRVAGFYENLGTCISLEILPVTATQLRFKNLVGGFYAVRLAEIEVY